MNLTLSRLVVGAAFVAASMLLPSQHQPAISGENYKEKVDRFDDRRTASYESGVGSECKLTKALKGKLYACSFVHSTESAAYPGIMFFKTSEGWDLRDFDFLENAKAILTFSNGVTERRSLPIRLSTRTFYGSTVGEVLIVRLGSIKDKLKNLTKLEAQYGSAEFLWINDRALTSRVMDFVGSVSNATKGKSYADSIEDTLFR